jgi:hypothetical protein
MKRPNPRPLPAREGEKRPHPQPLSLQERGPREGDHFVILRQTQRGRRISAAPTARCHFSIRMVSSRATPLEASRHANAEVTPFPSALPRFFSFALRAHFGMTKDRCLLPQNHAVREGFRHPGDARLPTSSPVIVSRATAKPKYLDCTILNCLSRHTLIRPNDTRRQAAETSGLRARASRATNIGASPSASLVILRQACAAEESRRRLSLEQHFSIRMVSSRATPLEASRHANAEVTSFPSALPRFFSFAFRSHQNDKKGVSSFCSPFPVGEGGEGVRSADARRRVCWAS